MIDNNFEPVEVRLLRLDSSGDPDEPLESRPHASWLYVMFDDGRISRLILAADEDPVLALEKARANNCKANDFASSAGDVRAAGTSHWSGEWPSVSVILCSTIERTHLLRSCVESLRLMHYPGALELVLVDNSAGGASRSLVDELTETGFRVVRESHRGLSRARNRGLVESSGSIVAFTDDDAVVESDWIERLVGRLQAEATPCVTGLVIPNRLDTEAQLWFERYFGGFSPGLAAMSYAWGGVRRGRGRTIDIRRQPDGMLLSNERLYVAAGHLGVGANMAFRRSILDLVGPFNSRLGAGTVVKGGEEIVAFAQILAMGETIAYEPSAIVRHNHRTTMEELERQVEGTGRSVSALLGALCLSDPHFIPEVAMASGGAAHRATLAGLTGFRQLSANAEWSVKSGDGTNVDVVESGYFAHLHRLEVAGKLKGFPTYAWELVKSLLVDRRAH